MILALSVVFFLELDLPGFRPTQSFNPHNDLVTKNEILGGGSAGIFSADKLSEFAINEVNPGRSNSKKNTTDRASIMIHNLFVIFIENLK